MRTRLETAHGALSLHRLCEPDHPALLQVLAQLSNSSNPRRFPGSNPCSLERADFPKLRQQPYYLAEKTDGVRFMLVCCRLQGRNVCALVDRSMAAWLLPLQALPTAMFQGSAVDCELAFNKVQRQWQLLAFDAYVVSGIPVYHLPFSHRMAGLKRAMAVYEYRAGDPVPVKIKSFIPATMFAAYHEHEALARQHFDVDGLILTPEQSEAKVGRHPELFKLKTRHTVDFLVASDCSGLMVFNPATKAHELVERLRQPAEPGAIAECARASDGLWDLVCLREDKGTANDLLTYQKTLVNMREGITIQELQHIFCP